MVDGLQRIRRGYVLDDDRCVRMLVSELLGRSGYAAEAFQSTQALFEALDRVQPDVVVLDLLLGRSDAIEVLRHLAATRYGGKILLISGRDEALLNEANAIGLSRGLAMLPPLGKPFSAADFLQNLEGETQPPRCASSPVLGRPTARTDLRFALDQGWLELWYQPKFDLKDSGLSGAEALVRVRHPDRGVLTPDAFHPPAGDPLHLDLAEFVMGRVCEDWTSLAWLGLPLRLAVNMPISIVSSPRFVELARELIPGDPAFPGLVAEITEDELIHDAALVKETATQLKLYDIDLSIDDFGTAYSALSRFLDLSFVEVKLDRSFVLGCAADPMRRAVCETTIDLAHRFGAELCAEGVENAEDLAALKAIGCDLAQGFYLGRPMPLAEFASVHARFADDRSSMDEFLAEIPASAL